MVDSDGKRVGSVGVTAVATFSQEKGHEGQFLGAELVVDRYVEKGNGDFEYAGRTVIPLNYGQAVHALGASGISAGVEAASQAAHCFTCESFKQDVVDHPWRTLGRAAQIGVYVGALAEPPTTAWGIAGLSATLIGTVADLGNQAMPDKP